MFIANINKYLVFIRTETFRTSRLFFGGKRILHCAKYLFDCISISTLLYATDASIGVSCHKMHILCRKKQIALRPFVLAPLRKNGKS